MGKCCAGMSGPLPEARLLFHLIIGQKSLFVSLPRSQTSTRSSLLSPCHFSQNPRGRGTEAACLGTLCHLLLIALRTKAVQTDPACHPASTFVFASSKEGTWVRHVTLSLPEPCRQAPPSCVQDQLCSPWAQARCAQGPVGRMVQLRFAYICPWQQICELRLPFWISGWMQSVWMFFSSC